MLRRETDDRLARAVGQAALDGLVALAAEDGPAALAELERSRGDASEEERAWIDEGIEQARDAAED